MSSVYLLSVKRLNYDDLSADVTIVKDLLVQKLRFMMGHIEALHNRSDLVNIDPLLTSQRTPQLTQNRTVLV